MEQRNIIILWTKGTGISMVSFVLDVGEDQYIPSLCLRDTQPVHWSVPVQIVTYWFGLLLFSELIKRELRAHPQHLCHVAIGLSNGRNYAMYQDLLWADEYLGDAYDELMQIPPDPHFIETVRKTFAEYGIPYW